MVLCNAQIPNISSIFCNCENANFFLELQMIEDGFFLIVWQWWCNWNAGEDISGSFQCFVMWACSCCSWVYNNFPWYAHIVSLPKTHLRKFFLRTNLFQMWREIFHTLIRKGGKFSFMWKFEVKNFLWKLLQEPYPVESRVVLGYFIETLKSLFFLPPHWVSSNFHSDHVITAINRS